MNEKTWDYNSRIPYYLREDELNNLSVEDYDRLITSEVFCMLPWVHMHSYPDGRVFQCCIADNSTKPIGSLKENTMAELWNNKSYKNIRKNMMQNKTISSCNRCYEQEKNGFFSMRNSANKHWGHLLNNLNKMPDDQIVLKDTKEDGEYTNFKLRYWDIRFSNLCNFKCRTCGPLFSSQWYDDEKAMWNNNSTTAKILFPGTDKNDILRQLLEHIDYVEEIYFAGGEPLIMEEHYIILQELIKRNKTNVSLLYNTNFSEMIFKNQNILEIWKDFDKVSVGASLDAMGTRAEFIRKGTNWNQVMRNRENMLRICPNVDFYISPTLSLMNALHVVNFHNDWINRGFITAPDLNINILQGPSYYRIDCLPAELKTQVISQYTDHIKKIDKKDSLRRTVNGFKSAINFINAKDNIMELKKFNNVTNKLDVHRNEKFYDVFPELIELKKYE